MTFNIKSPAPDSPKAVAFSTNPTMVTRYEKITQFNQQKIKLQKKDMIFTFTDGFADQFGGEKGKKFKYKNLKNLLLSIYYLPNRQQKEMLSNTFDKWKGDLEQVDDLLLIGLKI